jgi:hypothetical protein
MYVSGVLVQKFPVTQSQHRDRIRGRKLKKSNIVCHCSDAGSRHKMLRILMGHEHRRGAVGVSRRGRRGTWGEQD